MSGFEVGALVWAKLASYPYWPGRVTRLKDVKDKVIREQLGSTQANSELIWFFGTRNYAWVPYNMLVAYDDGYDEKAKNKRAKSMKGFVQGLKEAEGWKDNPKEISDDDEDRKNTPKKKEGKNHKSEKDQDSDKDARKKKDEESTKKKEDKKKKEEKESRKDEEDEEKDKRRESDGFKKKEKKKEERRHSVATDKYYDKKEDDKSSKKRKASDDEESNSTSHKRVKVSEFTPKKEKDVKRESTPQREEKMETDAPPQAQVDEDKDKVDSLENYVPKQPIPQAAMVKSMLTLSRHPVSKYHKLDFINYGEGYAVARAFFSDARPSSKLEVHAVLGAAYFLIDITSYAALLSQMHEGESAITQDIHVTVLTPIPHGSEVTVKARVVKTKQRAGLAFLDGEVWHNNKLMATAKVTKSLLEPDLLVKEATKEEKDKEKKENKENNLVKVIDNNNTTNNQVITSS